MTITNIYPNTSASNYHQLIAANKASNSQPLSSPNKSTHQGIRMSEKTKPHNRGLQLTTKNICFSRIHRHYRKNHGIHYELGRGKAVLDNSLQLEQYLHSYGSMISRQWQEIKRSLDLDVNELDIIDYGCGQGIGTIQVFDHLRLGGIPNEMSPIRETTSDDGHLKSVLNVNLIEASGIALSRAYEILNRYPTKSILNCINKNIDDICLSDLNISESPTKLHIFSNVLDIDTFDQLALLKKSLSIKGNHCIVAVSPRRSDGGKRMRDTFAHIVEQYNVQTQTKWDFRYKTQPHTAFVINMDV